MLGLHGGSGTDDGDFKKAISAGIVHIGTELRLAWRRGIEAALAGNSDEVVPYKIYSNAVSAMAAVAEERLRLFNAR
jgi:fructose-bisphosphate aldolase class II